MAFGQPSGPPASGRQIAELSSLLHDAGHTDFRDARGPMGFTQRQAAGKFTRDEASAFIDRLQVELQDAEPAPSGSRVATAQASEDRELADIPTERLAAELRSRGWMVRKA